MRKIRLAALAALALFAVVGPPKARAASVFGFYNDPVHSQTLPSPNRGHHRHRAYSRAARPRDAVHVRGGHPLLAVASRYLGRGNFTGHKEAWCRDAINSWARQAGIRLANNSHRAIDALRLGARVSNPRPGDLIVMRHHVSIFAGRTGGRIIGLGGNQSHRVRYSRYSPRRVVGFVRL